MDKELLLQSIVNLAKHIADIEKELENQFKFNTEVLTILKNYRALVEELDNQIKEINEHLAYENASISSR